jgi:hypothetical protein
LLKTGAGLSVLSLAVALFYLMAALEIDPGNLGDDFGDVYDTYLAAHSVETPAHQPVAVIPVLAVAKLLVVLGYTGTIGQTTPSRIVEIWPPPSLLLYLFWRVLRL